MSFSNVTNGGVYGGATSTALTITGATASMNDYEYEAVFSNVPLGASSPSTATTTAATLTVDYAPTVTANPTNVTINAGGNTSFTSAATGNPVPAIQWQVSTDGGATFTSVTNGGVYSGATTGTLSITAAMASMDGFLYEAVFGNTLSGANPPSTATTIAAELTVQYAPTITAIPFEATVIASLDVFPTATFTATAASNPAPTVQWQILYPGSSTYQNLRTNSNYSGVTANTLIVSGITTAMNDFQYRAVFTNGIGPSVSSTAATLNAIFQSQDAYTANAYAYQAYLYAYDAYVFGYGSYGTFVFSYYAFADAAIALQASSNGHMQLAEDYA